jgi:molybdopterin-synthase adenylyltransferase
MHMEQFPALPARPCLRPGVEVVPVDSESVLLRSFSNTVMLSGKFVSSQLPDLLHRMDGKATLEEISANASEAGRREIEQFLSLLSSKQLLGEGNSSDTDSALIDGSGVNTHEDAYWSLSGTSADEATRRLESASVVIVDLGGVGLTVTRTLAAAGVGKITAIDPHPVRASDAIFGYKLEDVGKSRVNAVARGISPAKCREFIPRVSTVQDLSDWDDLVAEADLVVLCSDGMSLAAYDATNEACIRHKTRWVSARIDRSRGIIGPFVVPEQTPCFMCYELRTRANADHPEDHEALYRHWKNTEAIPDDWPIIPPLASLVGDYLALDIQRVLGGRQLSMFYGRMFHVDFQTFESRFHEILKLPRCPACSRERARPLTRIWDIRPEAMASASAD